MGINLRYATCQQLEEPDRELLDREAFTGPRALVFFVFERALRDATSETIEPHIKREARGWLQSRSRECYDAEWYAENFDLKHILYACRYALVTGAALHNQQLLFVKRGMCHRTHRKGVA